MRLYASQCRPSLGELFVTEAAATDRIEVRSSRWWAFWGGRLTRFLFPARMLADHVGISTNIVAFWLTPWLRTDEHLPLSHIAEVTHTRGFFWDKISVESSGGLNPLVVAGLPKGQARTFVELARERINETMPPRQPHR
jgi:hypothetical protein